MRTNLSPQTTDGRRAGRHAHHYTRARTQIHRPQLACLLCLLARLLAYWLCAVPWRQTGQTRRLETRRLGHQRMDGPWLESWACAGRGPRLGLLGTGWLGSQERTCTWLEMEIWPVPLTSPPNPGPRYLTSTLGGGGLEQAARVPRAVLRTRPEFNGA